MTTAPAERVRSRFLGSRPWDGILKAGDPQNCNRSSRFAGFVGRFGTCHLRRAFPESDSGKPYYRSWETYTGVYGFRQRDGGQGVSTMYQRYGMKIGKRTARVKCGMGRNTYRFHQNSLISTSICRSRVVGAARSGPPTSTYNNHFTTVRHLGAPPTSRRR